MTHAFSGHGASLNAASRAIAIRETKWQASAFKSFSCNRAIAPEYDLVVRLA